MLELNANIFKLFWSVFSPHFTAFGQNTERYLSVFSPNAGKCGKSTDQNNFEYGHFLRSETAFYYSITFQYLQ